MIVLANVQLNQNQRFIGSQQVVPQKCSAVALTAYLANNVS